MLVLSPIQLQCDGRLVRGIASFGTEVASALGCLRKDPRELSAAACERQEPEVQVLVTLTRPEHDTPTDGHAQNGA